MSEVILPPYLHNTEPLEPEDIPLQLALLTMEVAALRERMTAIADLMQQMASLIRPDEMPEWLDGRAES
jgi:hypothetical protein